MRYYPTPLNPQPSTLGFGSPSIHNVTQVTREAAPEQSVESGVEWMEDFDFEAEVPCAGCPRPADYLVTRQCGRCGSTHWAAHPEPRTQPCCAPHWRKAMHASRLHRCDDCGHSSTKADFFRIVEVLR